MVGASVNWSSCSREAMRLGSASRSIPTSTAWSAGSASPSIRSLAKVRCGGASARHHPAAPSPSTSRPAPPGASGLAVDQELGKGTLWGCSHHVGTNPQPGAW